MIGKLQILSMTTNTIYHTTIMKYTAAALENPHRALLVNRKGKGFNSLQFTICLRYEIFGNFVELKFFFLKFWVLIWRFCNIRA